MEKDFKFDPRLYDSLNEEQKGLLNNTISQYEKVILKNQEKVFNEKTNELKAQWQQELEQQNLIQKEQEQFLNEIPNQNKDLVNKLLEKGITPEVIKTDFNNLLIEPKTHVDLNSIINGNDPVKENMDEKEWIRKAKSGELNPNNVEHLRIARDLKKKGLI